MFGDDPDPTVTTARVGSGTIFGRACEEVCGLTSEPRLGLAVGSGLCRRSQAERREERPGDCFRRPKTSDYFTDYNVAIVIRWGVKQTPNAMKLDRRSIYTIIRPHANFQPNPRTFPATYKISFRTCHGRVQVCLGSERTTEGTGRPGQMQVLKT